MAALRHRGCPQRNRPCWDEAACVTHYGMMSLHEVFETVGSQLTETEIELLSFLLNELCPSAHPLDPAGWTVDYHKEDSESSAVSPSPQLLKAWRHLKPRASQLPFVAPFQPKSGLELLLELERRGYLSDGNLEPLLQLLRVLTRHDLLPLVSHKKRRTVSPERTGGRCGPNSRGGGCASGGRQTELPLPFYTQQLRSSIHVPGPHVRRRRRKRGNGWSRRPKKSSKQKQQLPPPTPPPHKKSCMVSTPGLFFFAPSVHSCPLIPTSASPTGLCSAAAAQTRWVLSSSFAFFMEYVLFHVESFKQSHESNVELDS
ncbi:death effector domain-containing 1 isoform X4 [Cynoglossus semilaevis]|uniref:death effector domain-containing 1 isoform X4 n=1 Tax=Cynoglossus semilaevis TaxID=244447 RepID=UPI000D626288|nr:DNA-binding death effector domain-containing protein 2 isoform X4 [Cynoglossus semilaevis]